MQHWRIQQPQSLDLDGVHRLEVRLVGGRVDVVGRTPDTNPDSAPGATHLEVSRLDGPLDVHLENGTLSITHERLTWGGLFDWVGGRKAHAVVSVCVPTDCPVELGVVSADAVVSGIVADRTTVKSVSGNVTLDGVRSDITARTVSGDLESRDVTGDLVFTSVSGDLTVAGGDTGELRAETVSGDVTLDLSPRPGARVDLSTVAGDLRVRLPESFGLVVDAKTMSGSLDCVFEGLSTTRRSGSAAMAGTIGDGTARLQARTVSGDVAVLSRAASGGSGAA